MWGKVHPPQFVLLLNLSQLLWLRIGLLLRFGVRLAFDLPAEAKGLYFFGHCDNEKFMLDIRPAKLHRGFESTKVGIIIIAITVSV